MLLTTIIIIIILTIRNKRLKVNHIFYVN